MKSITFILCLISFSSSLMAKSPVMYDVHEEINFKDDWYNAKKSDEENFKKLISALQKSETGRQILNSASKKAGEQGFTLMDVIGIGEGSLTDTTLIRRFSASDPTQVMYETRSKVYVNRRLKMLDAVLDFSHELVHFTHREPFNPYVSHFQLKDFIKSTVEGNGGEVDAFLAECQVLKELKPGAGFRQSNCQRILNQETGRVSKELGIIEFYKVGKHYDDLKKDLDKFKIGESDLPKASAREALFISSAYGLPYPVAAVKEYTNIMDRVCKNDQNRINLLQEKVTRSPASDSFYLSAQSYESIFEDFQSRCNKFVSK